MEILMGGEKQTSGALTNANLIPVFRCVYLELPTFRCFMHDNCKLSQDDTSCAVGTFKIRKEVRLFLHWALFTSIVFIFPTENAALRKYLKVKGIYCNEKMALVIA